MKKVTKCVYDACPRIPDLKLKLLDTVTHPRLAVVSHARFARHFADVFVVFGNSHKLFFIFCARINVVHEPLSIIVASVLLPVEPWEIVFVSPFFNRYVILSTPGFN